MCGCQRHHDDTADCTCICPEHRNFDVAYSLAMSRYDAMKALRDEVAGSVRGLMVSDNLGDVHEEVDRLRSAIGLPALEGDYLSGWNATDWEGLGEL